MIAQKQRQHLKEDGTPAIRAHSGSRNDCANVGTRANREKKTLILEHTFNEMRKR